MRSFCEDVKEELLHLALGSCCCIRAELAAWVMVLGRGSALRASQPAVARRLFGLIKECTGRRPRVILRRDKYAANRRTYAIRLAGASNGQLPGVGEVLQALEGEGLARCCLQAYLRGAFLAAGSVTSPDGAHHLEMVLPTRSAAEGVVRALARLGLRGRCRCRRGRWVVYLKGAEEIGHFLALVGAHRSLLEYENVRVVRHLRGQVNRVVNCETANLGKAIEASLRQVQDIRVIAQRVGLSSLPPHLEQTARARLAHPEMTMRELGQLLDPPVGKSGVRYRLERLRRLARRLSAKTAP